MSLQSQLDSHQIDNGEFFVLVPFAKKTQQVSSAQLPAEAPATLSLCSRDSSMLSAADSAWLDMMSDLSHISSSGSSQKSSYEKEVLVSETSERFSTSTRKKRKVDSNNALHDILSSGSKDVFDQQTRVDISRHVGSVNCLSNSKTGKCLLFERSGRKFEKHGCLCPSWLKKILKCFSFLNIFYAFLHAQCKCLTWTIIEGALKHPSNFGLDDDVCISDVEKLSVLCPKLVVNLGKDKLMETKPGSAITIGDSSVESTVPCESTKKHRNAGQCMSTLINAIEKRESAFRTELWRLIICSMVCLERSNC